VNKVRANKAQITLFFFLVVSSVAVIDVNTSPSQPVIQVVPKISTAAFGETFTVNITVADVTIENSINGVYGWEVDMSFNASIIEVVDIIEGPWLKTGGDTTWNKMIDNDNGIVVGTSFLSEYPDEGVIGSGILANVTFHVLDIGAFPLLLYKTVLRTYDGENILVVDHAPVGGFFSNVHDVAIVSVTPSDTQVNEGDLVDIDVVVANEGDFSETFDVTTYWNIGSSAWRDVINETKTGTQLENGTSTSPPLRFTWDTTALMNGTYTISAEASVVAGEMNTIDNTKIDGQVTVGTTPANFTYSPKIPLPLANETVVTFTSISYDPNVTVANWEWDLDGDGTFDAVGENVTYIYTEAKIHTAVLVVTDDQGKKAFSYEFIRVVTPPVANFAYSPKPVLVRQPVTFTSTSYDIDGSVVGWNWDLDGDGTFDAFEEEVTHTYNEVKTYTVNLTVADNDDLSDSIARNVEVLTRRDVALVQMKLNKKTLYAGELIIININVLNNGTETETFNVTAYYDSTLIQTVKVADLAPLDQAPNNTKQITINWVTKDLSTSKYNITAQVILDGDEDLTNNKASPVTIEATVFDVAITNVEVSPAVVLAGSLLDVTVVVKNKGSVDASPLISLWITNATHTLEGPDSKIISLKNGTEKTETFTPWNASARGFSPGIYTLSAKAELIGEPSAMQEDNEFIYGEITLGASLISIFATPEKITLGSSINLNGSITPLRWNVNVTIHHRVSGNDTWGVLTIVTTDDNGTYSYLWTPEAAGTYEVIASWEGDNNSLPSESETVTIIVSPATPILLYALVAVAAVVVVIVVAIYFTKIRKPKPA